MAIKSRHSSLCHPRRHDGRRKSAQRDGLFNPQNHVVPGVAVVIAQVVVQTELGDLSGFQ